MTVDEALAIYEDLAGQPFRVKGDDGSEVEQVKLSDVLEAIKFLSNRSVMSRDGGGLIPGTRIGQIAPPDARGDA